MPLSLFCSFMRYWLFSWHRNGHGLHSPFVYDMVTKAFYAARRKVDFKQEEAWRKRMLKDTRTICVNDHGVGSKHLGAERLVADIARRSAVAPRYGRLLACLVQWVDAKNVLELGTSVGIGTRYLAKYADSVVSIDACAETLSVARTDAPTNCQFHCGTFRDVLPQLAVSAVKFDFVYIDGNHSLEGTLENFELLLPMIHDQTVLVFDDIHWSKEMLQAWERICGHPMVRTTVDVWQFGLVLFRPEMAKQHFTVRY